MSDTQRPKTGTIGWTDLTVDNAESLSAFYQQVVGWQASPVDMGGYNDFTMSAQDGTCVAGVCHAKGNNAGLPAQWLIYINVDNLDASIESCQELGGKVIAPARTLAGQGRYCVIQDPAGAVTALFEPV